MECQRGRLTGWDDQALTPECPASPLDQLEPTPLFLRTNDSNIITDFIMFKTSRPPGRRISTFPRGAQRSILRLLLSARRCRDADLADGNSRCGHNPSQNSFRGLLKAAARPKWNSKYGGLKK